MVFKGDEPCARLDWTLGTWNEGQMVAEEAPGCMHINQAMPFSSRTGAQGHRETFPKPHMGPYATWCHTV